MIRNSKIEMRAWSLPPENSIMTGEYNPLKNSPKSKLDQVYPKDKILTRTSIGLCLSGDVFPGCSDYDPCSPASVDIANGNIKNSPSDSSSVLTDEDSGCQVFYFGNALRSGPKYRMGRACSTSTLDSSSVQFFNGRDEFLAAMTEDLADWLSRLYPNIAKDLYLENFFDRISDGVLLCHHATELHRLLERNVSLSVRNGERVLEYIYICGNQPLLPANPPVFQARGFSIVGKAGSSFWARDNVANFIHWCRAVRLPDSVLFETEDLVSRKNLHSVIVCLLEIARLGGRVGMEIPEIIHLEKDINNEIAQDAQPFGTLLSYDLTEDMHELENKTLSVSIGSKESDTSELALNGTVAELAMPVKPTENREKFKRQASLRAKKQEVGETKNIKTPYVRPVIDMRTLDEIVRIKLSECRCEQTFPMIRISEGRYLFGDKSMQIFVRILRNHVMVRVGGGWDTLDHFLQKYDECRKTQRPCSPSTTDKFFQFGKALESSTGGEAVDVSSVLCMASTDSSGLLKSVVSSEELQVAKEGREIAYSSTEVVCRSPPQCNHAHLSSQEFVELIESERTEDTLIPIINQTVKMPDVAQTLKIPLNIGLADFAEIYGQDLNSKSSHALSAASDVDEFHFIPVIDQSASEFEEKVAKLDTIPTRTLPEPHLLRSHYKIGYNAANRRLFSSIGACGIEYQKAISTNNLASIGGPPISNLYTLSKATVSPNEHFSVNLASKLTRPQLWQTVQMNASEGANLSTGSSVNSCAPQLMNTSKMNVWERLSTNALRNPTEWKIASPSVSQFKGPNVSQHYNKLRRETERTSTVKRRNSVATTRKPVAPQTVAVPSRPEKSLHPSTTKLPEEKSRIPRPANAFTVARARSKSVGSRRYISLLNTDKSIN